MGVLDGKVVVVTGASRGIGAAIAQRFAAEGARLVIAARTLDAQTRSPYQGTLADTVARIEAGGGLVRALAADLSSRDDRARIVATAVETFGTVDVLVNNAAATWARPFLEFTDKQVNVMFDVHVRAAFELAQLVLPAMIEHGSGAILNMTSAASRPPQGPPYEFDPKHDGTLVYAMCKAALERFTLGLAAEVHRHGVVVNALGPTKSVMTYGMNHPAASEGHPERIEAIEATVEAALALCTPGHPDRTGTVTDTEAVLGRYSLDVRGLDGGPLSEGL